MSQIAHDIDLAHLGAESADLGAALAIGPDITAGSCDQADSPSPRVIIEPTPHTPVSPAESANVPSPPTTTSPATTTAPEPSTPPVSTAAPTAPAAEAHTPTPTTEPEPAPHPNPKVAALQAQVARLTHELGDADADAIVQRHIRLLHTYNEIKDGAQALIGRYALLTNSTVTGVHRELGLSLHE